jgi:hypothetical protein
VRCRRKETHQGSQSQALAGPGFPDDPDRMAALKTEGDTVNDNWTLTAAFD